MKNRTGGTFKRDWQASTPHDTISPVEQTDFMTPKLKAVGKKAWLRFLLIVVLGIATGSANAAAPSLEQTTLFKAGEAGVTLYRIPGIVVTTNGTVLVYCEARKNSRNDWADSDTCLRRSTNGGKSFQPAKKIAHRGERLTPGPAALAHGHGSLEDQTVNNPVAIVDQQTGEIHFLYCVNYEHCYYLKSTDDGVRIIRETEKERD